MELIKIGSTLIETLNLLKNLPEDIELPLWKEEDGVSHLTIKDVNLTVWESEDEGFDYALNGNIFDGEGNKPTKRAAQIACMVTALFVSE